MARHKLDNRRAPCAAGLIRAKGVMAELPLGGILELTTRDRFAPFEVPAWVDKEGFDLLAVRRRGWWLFSTFTFEILKTREVTPPQHRGGTPNQRV